MDRLTITETELFLRWWLYHATPEQIMRARSEMPVYFDKAWAAAFACGVLPKREG